MAFSCIVSEAGKREHKEFIIRQWRGGPFLNLMLWATSPILFVSVGEEQRNSLARKVGNRSDARMMTVAFSQTPKGSRGWKNSHMSAASKWKRCHLARVLIGGHFAISTFNRHASRFHDLGEFIQAPCSSAGNISLSEVFKGYFCALGSGVLFVQCCFLFTCGEASRSIGAQKIWWPRFHQVPNFF